MEAWEKDLDFHGYVSDAAIFEAVNKTKKRYKGRNFKVTIQTASYIIEALDDIVDKENAFLCAQGKAFDIAENARVQWKRDLMWLYMGRMQKAMDAAVVID